MAAVLPHTLHGLGGVGKSQLAIEYAYRFAEDYDVVWWISAEEPAAVRSSLAALAPRLGLQGGGNVAEALPVVLDALRRGEPYRRWLLVFDNADQPEELTSLFPYGPGHILVTSRNQRWAGAAETIEVDVFDRDESVALLRQRGRELSPRDADRVAGRLGDLPLALEQAAAWQAETGMSVDEYLRLLDQRLIQLMSENPPGGYPSTVAATWSLALERLRGPMPASVQLLELCAFLAPEPVSWTLLSVGRFVALPAPLNGTVRDPILLGRAIREIGRYALARVDHARNSLHMHRLVQAVLREQLSPEQREEMRGHVHALLAAADPGDPDDPANWERYQGLWPHLAASSAVDSTDADARQLVLHQARCLFMRGDYESGGEFAGAVLERWRETLGKDHPDTLTMARHLGTMLRMQGEYETARALDEDTLARARKVFGEDHEETLLMVNNHSAGLRVLGEFAAARALDEDGLARARRVFGDEHPRTLMMANNLAVDMRLVGDFRAARTLDEDTFPKRRQVLGEDHPFTLFSVNNIARDLRECGEYAASATLQERTLARYRLRLGKDHPDAMRAAKNYAVSLRKAGAYEAARALAEENLTLYRRKFGDDHPDTLAAGTNLSNDRRLTGDLAGARTVAEDTLRRYRRVLGEEHPYTLACATNLATVLRAAGEHAAARAMDEDTLPRFRQVLGDDHPFTLTCASNLANDLNAAREHQAARALQEDTLTRFGRVLGEEHPYTLACASNLAVTLRAVREHAAARPLAEETVDKYREVLGPDHPDTAAAMAGKPIECDIEPAPW